MYNSIGVQTCRQKESVLDINQEQIVNLTLPRHYFKDKNGCKLHASDDYPKDKTTPRTTTKPLKSITFTVNLGTRKYYTVPMEVTTASNSESTTDISQNLTISNYTESVDDNLEDFDNSTEEIFDVDNLFGEEIEYNETVGKPVEKRSVPQSYPDYNKQNGLVTCRNARTFRSARARWWFIALSNCGSHKGIHVKYQILMTNGRPGDYWHEHFSADEFYVLPVLLAFIIAYGMLLFAITICAIELKSRQLLHTTYKIFVLSVVLQFFGMGITSLAYLKYAVVGVLPYRTKILGNIFMGACETIFLLLLLLLAKGYTTTRARIPLSASVKLTIFMCLYSITYLTLFIYEAKVFDPGEILYLYESPAGYGLIVLRIVAWWMFIYSTIFTLKHYPEKANFYYPFNICGTLWFVAGPAFILSANSYVDKWVRESVVCGVLLFITFAGHLMFLILTLPAMANKNFPYHIRTTQIGVMEIHGISGTGTLDQFNHHPYQPTAPPDQTVIIPLHPDLDEISSDVFLATQIRQEQDQRDRDHSDEEEPEIDRKQDSIENVLKWSTVKGCVGSIENGHDSRLGSSRSKVENGTSLDGISNSPSLLFSAKNLNKPNDSSLGNEWTKDVPFELFTISKMVINKPNTNNET